MSNTDGAGRVHRVTLSTLGVCSVTTQGRLLSSVPSMIFRLASYLYLSGRERPVSRQKVGCIFWPDADNGQAAANLRQSLVRIRRFQAEHGFQLIESNFTLVYLDRVNLDWDLSIVMDALDGNDTGSVSRVCRFYGGDLLSDVAESSPDFEDWLSDQRAWLRQSVVEKLADALERMAEIPVDLRQTCARVLLAIDPGNEQAFRQLMREAAENHDYTRLRQLFERYERSMMEEYGVTGSSDTRALYAQLMAGEQ